MLINHNLFYDTLHNYCFCLSILHALILLALVFYTP